MLTPLALSSMSNWFDIDEQIELAEKIGEEEQKEEKKSEQEEELDDSKEFMYLYVPSLTNFLSSDLFFDALKTKIQDQLIELLSPPPELT